MHVLDAYLAHRIRELERRSPQLQASNAAIRRGHLPVYITTPDRIDEVPATASALLADRLGGRVGELAAFRIGRTDSIFMIVVRVDVERLAGPLHADWLRAGPSGRGDSRYDPMHRDIDAVLIHELWGHLAPLAASVHLRARCADPDPEQDPLASCVMRRENELRASLGLSARSRYTW